MSPLKWLSLASLLALGLGCIGPGRGGDVSISIQGSYEKKLLTPTGFTGTVTRPARYCYVEVRQSSPDQFISSWNLDNNGAENILVPRGLTCYLRLYAAVEVPAASGSNFVLRGSVLDGAAPGSGATDSARASTFENTFEWVADSDDFSADGPRTVTVVARAGTSDLSAGAFAIADQMTTFALKFRELEPGRLLPNLHVYWTTSSNPASQTRTYPAVLRTGNGNIYKLASGRAVFTGAVYGQQGGAPYAETDEFDDAVLQETFQHLLFADYSLKEDGSSALSLLRRDNDNVYVSRYRPSESTVAFVGGTCDFLAAAALGDSRLMDSYNDGTGHLQVETFDLARHDQVPSGQRGEFTRGSVAASLWGIYRNAAGGGSTGLQTLWAALRSNVALSDGTGEYNGATLGCYPSFLVGVRSRLSSGQWSTALGELQAEAIPDPSPSYFNGTALYQPITFGQIVNGSVQTYAPSEARYYDWDQSKAYRFTQNGTSTRTVTMTPTGGQDLYLEVLGPGGWVNGSYSNPVSTRNLALPNLTPGVYAIRVRAGNTTSTTSASFSLSLQ